MLTSRLMMSEERRLELDLPARHRAPLAPPEMEAGPARGTQSTWGARPRRAQPPGSLKLQSNQQSRALAQLHPPHSLEPGGQAGSDLGLRPQGRAPSPPARQSRPRCPGRSPGLPGLSWTARQPGPPCHPSPRSAPPRSAAPCPHASCQVRGPHCRPRRPPRPPVTPAAGSRRPHANGEPV